MEEKITMTVRQAAEHLGVSVNLLYKLVHAGEFPPAIKIGDKIFVLKAELEKWIEERKGKPI